MTSSILFQIKECKSKRFQKKIPTDYCVSDMEIYKDKMFFLATYDKKTVMDKKFKAILFITDIHGKLLTKFLHYDGYNKVEGITIDKRKHNEL